MLRRADHLLLDFDSDVAEALCTAVADRGYALSGELRTAVDPFDMLTYATQIGPEVSAAVEAEFSRWEQRAVLQTQTTTGTCDVLTWLTQSGRSVTIVSNNAASAVETYLAAAGLDGLVVGISARHSEDVS